MYLVVLRKTTKISAKTQPGVRDSRSAWVAQEAGVLVPTVADRLGLHVETAKPSVPLRYNPRPACQL